MKAEKYWVVKTGIGDIHSHRYKLQPLYYSHYTSFPQSHYKGRTHLSAMCHVELAAPILKLTQTNLDALWKVCFIYTNAVFSCYVKVMKTLQGYCPGKTETIFWTNNRYYQTSNIRCTLAGNKIVDHSDVVEAPPIGTAPSPSSILT